MDYFKINYSKLKHLPEKKFNKLIILLVIVIIFVIFCASKIVIYEKEQVYGIYLNEELIVKINNELSKKLDKCEYIMFNDSKVNFKIKEYGEYEIINNEIYQEIKIIVDKDFYHNEVGKVEFYYDKKSVLKYIINLLK